MDTSAYLEAILLLGILSFIGTVAFAKFLEKGEIIEDDRNVETLSALFLLMESSLLVSAFGIIRLP